MQGFFTVSGEFENVIIIERSKFICSIKGIADEKEAKEFIEFIRKKYSLANHHCYAYIADDKGLLQKFSDDSEPQGTAGLPMLEVLKNRRVYKTVAVVTRYFGGIKLGTGGLTRAYSGSVSEALNIATVLNMQEAVKLQLSPDYEMYSRLIKLISNENLNVLNTAFNDCVCVTIAVKKEYLEAFKIKIRDVFNGKLDIVELESDYYSFK